MNKIMNDRLRFKVYYYNDVFDKWIVYENPEFITGDGTCRVFDNSESGANEWRENVKICQCTGLKDKNGKLIYEGDIITDYSDYLFPIYWNKTQAGFKALVIKNFPPQRILGTESMNFFKTENYEIIGNIFENEELLNIQSSVFGTINSKSLSRYFV